MNKIEGEKREIGAIVIGLANPNAPVVQSEYDDTRAEAELIKDSQEEFISLGLA